MDKVTIWGHRNKKIKLVNNNIMIERYKGHGIDFIEGYIQCLFNKNHIKLNEAIKLSLRANSL